MSKKMNKKSTKVEYRGEVHVYNLVDDLDQTRSELSEIFKNPLPAQFILQYEDSNQCDCYVDSNQKLNEMKQIKPEKIYIKENPDITVISEQFRVEKNLQQRQISSKNTANLEREELDLEIPDSESDDEEEGSEKDSDDEDEKPIKKNKETFIQKEKNKKQKNKKRTDEDSLNQYKKAQKNNQDNTKVAKKKQMKNKRENFENISPNIFFNQYPGNGMLGDYQSSKNNIREHKTEGLKEISNRESEEMICIVQQIEEITQLIGDLSHKLTALQNGSQYQTNFLSNLFNDKITEIKQSMKKSEEKFERKLEEIKANSNRNFSELKSLIEQIITSSQPKKEEPIQEKKKTRKRVQEVKEKEDKEEEEEEEESSEDESSKSPEKKKQNQKGKGKGKGKKDIKNKNKNKKPKRKASSNSSETSSDSSSESDNLPSFPSKPFINPKPDRNIPLERSQYLSHPNEYSMNQKNNFNNQRVGQIGQVYDYRPQQNPAVDNWARQSLNQIPSENQNHLQKDTNQYDLQQAERELKNKIDKVASLFPKNPREEIEEIYHSEPNMSVETFIERYII